MSDKSMGDRVGDHISRNIDHFIEFLDLDITPYGKELEFAERNSATLSIIIRLYGEMPVWISQYVFAVIEDGVADPGIIDCPHYEFSRQDVSSELSKSVSVMVRNRIREIFNLPRLSSKDISDFNRGIPLWSFDERAPRGRLRGGELGAYNPSDEDIAEAAKFFINNFPDEIIYIYLINNLAHKQGYIGRDQVSGNGILISRAYLCLLEVLPDIRNYSSLNGEIEVLRSVGLDVDRIRQN